MKSIGIIGQSGFIGTHLFNRISLLNKEYSLINFKKSFFSDKKKFQDFIRKCNIVVHLSGVNRAKNPDDIYNENMLLTDKLIDALDKSKSKAHIIFSSSTQESLKNPYGSSKKESSTKLQNFTDLNDLKFTSLIIPNVFGPFCKPYYNSVISTFCHQIINEKNPKIDIDASLKLIYVDDLIDIIINCFEQTKSKKIINIPHYKQIKVSNILTYIKSFKSSYIQNGSIPDLNDPFIKNLFNTFRSYLNYNEIYPFKLKINSDDRGSFIETMKLSSGGQVSFSTTRPNVTRGNHFHTHKVERFTVIQGKARIEFRKIDNKKKYVFYLDGSSPSFVDMPIWYTHSITNIGNDELYTLFWVNEVYNIEKPDTYFMEV
jgi:UDP-2-acetamido-2,6-beta-L-arabino-hexul-4-ose reductase